MGRIVSFRRRRGRAAKRSAAAPRRRGGRSGGRARRESSWSAAFAAVRVPILLIFLAAASWLYAQAGAWEPPGFLQTEPQRIEGRFTRCGIGRGYYCVIDGDTFKLGDQNVRVVGIDTAEVDAACPAEAAQAEASTAALQSWLNRGPFRISARVDEPTDRYGRALRIVKRLKPDGSEDRLADHMRREGGARGYGGGGRGGWC